MITLKPENRERTQNESVCYEYLYHDKYIWYNNMITTNS